MEVRILYFEDCPNVGLAEQRVRDLAAGDPELQVAPQRVADPADAGTPEFGPPTSDLLAAGDPEIRVARQRVADPADAAAAGLHGSPTILIDGVDPFVEPGTETSWACRVFVSADGIQGAPSTEQLRAAMGRGGRPKRFGSVRCRVRSGHGATLLGDRPRHSRSLVGSRQLDGRIGRARRGGGASCRRARCGAATRRSRVL